MTETIVIWITLLAVGWTALMLTAILLIERAMDEGEGG